MGLNCQGFFILHFLVIFSILFYKTSFTLSSPVEHDLHKFILQNYSRLIRPVLDPNHTLPVNITYNFQQILRLDEATSRVFVSMFIEITWYDAFLKWDPLQFSGIRKTRVSLKQHWIPPTDFTMSSSTGERCSGLVQDTVPTLLHHTGKLQRSSECILDIPCEASGDYIRFPYEQRNCILHITSKLYLASEVYLGLFASYNDQTNTNRLTGTWKVKKMQVTSMMNLVGEGVWPTAFLHVFMVRSGDMATRIRGLVYPLHALLVPLLFFIHPMSLTRVLLCILLFAMLVLQVLGSTNIPAIHWNAAGGNSVFTLPPSVLLLESLMALVFLQLLWFVYSYHVCVQLPQTSSYWFKWVERLTRTGFCAQLLRHYPRRSANSSSSPSRLQQLSLEVPIPVAEEARNVSVTSGIDPIAGLNDAFSHDENEELLPEGDEPGECQVTPRLTSQSAQSQGQQAAEGQPPPPQPLSRTLPRRVVPRVRTYTERELACMCVDNTLLLMYFVICFLLVIGLLAKF